MRAPGIQFVPIDDDALNVPQPDNRELYAMIDGLDSAMVTLPERHRRALELRFYDGMILRKIGRKFGVTREQARQYIAKGLRLLRHPERMRMIVGVEQYAERVAEYQPSQEQRNVDHALRMEMATGERRKTKAKPANRKRAMWSASDARKDIERSAEAFVQYIEKTQELNRQQPWVGGYQQPRVRTRKDGKLVVGIHPENDRIRRGLFIEYWVRFCPKPKPYPICVFALPPHAG